jgi:hypothetical protein
MPLSPSIKGAVFRLKSGLRNTLVRGPRRDWLVEAEENSFMCMSNSCVEAHTIHRHVATQSDL